MNNHENIRAAVSDHLKALRTLSDSADVLQAEASRLRYQPKKQSPTIEESFRVRSLGQQLGMGVVEWNEARGGPWTEAQFRSLVATAHWFRINAQFSSRLSVRRVRHHGQGLYRPSPTGGPFILARYRLLTHRRAPLVQFQSRRYQPLFLFRRHPFHVYRTTTSHCTSANSHC